MSEHSSYDSYEQTSLAEGLDSFYENGWITDRFYLVKSGKEATVYCCEASQERIHKTDQPAHETWFAAKVYRSHRSFRNDSVYQQGRVILSGRVKRAVEKGTAMGRKAQSALWIGHEFEHLKTLHKAGVSVPCPYASGENAILMEYLGEPGVPAPPLHSMRLTPAQARRAFDDLLEDFQRLLSCNLVHADLSPYNILYWNDRPRIIDLPQAVDPRFNPQAYELLWRDIQNVCRYFERYGIRTSADRLAADLWQQWQFAGL